MGKSGQRGVAAAMLAMMAACSSPPPATYDLSAAPRPAAAQGRGQLSVAEPLAISLLDSERIVVRTSETGVAYLSGAQWSERLPKLLQARLIQSFENARRVGSVGRPGDRVIAAYQLNTDIRTFEVQEASREAVVEITARLVNDRTGQVVAAEMFAARVPVEAISGEGAARGLDQASQSLLANIVRWASGRA